MCEVCIDEAGETLLRGVLVLLLLFNAGLFLASVAPGAITENEILRFLADLPGFVCSDYPISVLHGALLFSLLKNGGLLRLLPSSQTRVRARLLFQYPPPQSGL